MLRGEVAVAGASLYLFRGVPLKFLKSMKRTVSKGLRRRVLTYLLDSGLLLYRLGKGLLEEEVICLILETETACY